jgi:CheY-like chemotaxis protein
MTDKKVLVVDDEQDAIIFLVTILKKEGLKVITAMNGEEGLAKAQSENPDLVILDVEMPKLSGFQVFDAMRKEDSTKDIPIIMLTGVKEKTGIGFSSEEMGEFYGKEPSAYIEKPIDPEKVAAAAKEALGL